MSVQQCPDCSGKVSYRAKICPHCGAPLGRKFFKLICLLVVIALGAGGYFFWSKVGGFVFWIKPDPKQQEEIREGFEDAKEKVKQGYQGAKKKIHDLTED